MLVNYLQIINALQELVELFNEMKGVETVFVVGI